MTPDYIIEEFFDKDSNRTNYRMKYGKFIMIIPRLENGHTHLMQIQHAMSRLKHAYDNQDTYLPPVQIKKVED